MRHRRTTRLSAATGLTAVLLLAAACARPGGVDGDLTNGWAAMAPASGFEPAASTCHGATFDPVGARATYDEIDCNLPHRTETVFVGTYPSPAAEADEPPAAGSAGARAAYQVCDGKTTDYVGGQWRDARLWIGVTNPSGGAWSGGARWFRCEVVQLASVEDPGVLVERSGSLRNALADGAAGIRLGCYAVQSDRTGAIGGMPPASCTGKHNAEYVGVWTAKGLDYPRDDADWAKFHDGCRGLIATYANVPNDKDLQYRTGVISLPGGDDVWQLGDYGVRCYLWLEGVELTAPLKGKGSKALPIQFK
jgi:Septum formation